MEWFLWKTHFRARQYAHPTFIIKIVAWLCLSVRHRHSLTSCIMRWTAVTGCHRAVIHEFVQKLSGHNATKKLTRGFCTNSANSACSVNVRSCVWAGQVVDMSHSWQVKASTCSWSGQHDSGLVVPKSLKHLQQSTVPIESSLIWKCWICCNCQKGALTLNVAHVCCLYDTSCRGSWGPSAIT